MTKSKHFFQNLLKPFTSTSARDQHEEDLEEIAAKEQKKFSFEALVAATKNFHASNKLGEGGFGPVFQGKLSDGREIAVKRLSQRSAQGDKEFLNEAKLLSGVQHRNVVNLLGYCARDPEKLLVYEYVANQSLDKLLFSLNRNMRKCRSYSNDKGLQLLHTRGRFTLTHPEWVILSCASPFGLWRGVLKYAACPRIVTIETIIYVLYATPLIANWF